MRVNEYKLMLDENKLYVQLMKERGRKYAGTRLTSPEEVYNFMCSQFQLNELAEEYAYCLYFRKNKCLGVSKIGHGTSDAVAVSSASVFTRALLLGASEFVIVHNHPSGDLRPSAKDVVVSENLNKAAKLLHLEMLDFIIVGSNNVLSFRNNKIGGFEDENQNQRSL